VFLRFLLLNWNHYEKFLPIWTNRYFIPSDFWLSSSLIRIASSYLVLYLDWYLTYGKFLKKRTVKTAFFYRPRSEDAFSVLWNTFWRIVLRFCAKKCALPILKYDRRRTRLNMFLKNCFLSIRNMVNKSVFFIVKDASDFS
jgi:hypothetical protein